MIDIEFGHNKVRHIENLLQTIEAQIEKDIYNFLVDLKKQTYIDYISECKGKGYTTQQIADHLGKPYEFIHRLGRYGKKGLITPTIRKSVIARDNSKCQVCGDNYKLHIHHISNPTSREQDNLIALCPKCHKQEHKRIDEEVKIPN